MGGAEMTKPRRLLAPRRGFVVSSLVRKAQMRIDVHAHYYSKEYLEMIEASGAPARTTEPGRRTLKPTRAADMETRLAAMDRGGVDVQVLSVAAVPSYAEDERTAVALARFANDLYADVVGERPHRFAAFASLPLPHIDASLAEIEHALDRLGMVGVTVTTSILGRSLADPAFDPIYAELDRRGSVLFIHPSGNACGSPLLEKDNLIFPLGAPFEDTIAAIHLMQADFPRRFPRVKAILPHLGGTLPFLTQRLDHMAERFMPGKGVPSEVARRFWYDTVNAYPPALRCACDAFGADRLLFGTDYPFWAGEAHQLAVDYLERAGLDDEERRGIERGNALALFGERLVVAP
jgi:aminocarboxymuconate-semialdehyde decarboxylase